MAKLNIRVGNITRDDAGVYIGRKSGVRPTSPLSNPYRMRDESQRGVVIAKYRKWLWAKIVARDPKVTEELWRLLDLAKRPEGVTLLCWCAPKPCHGDVIASALRWLDEEIRKEDEVTRVAVEIGGIPVDIATGEVVNWN